MFKFKNLGLKTIIGIIVILIILGMCSNVFAANNTKVFTDKQKLAADVDGDGHIGEKDSNLILQYTVGKIKKFPVQDYTLGDVDGNGSLDSGDALFVLQYESGKRTLTDTQKLAGDVDGDRHIGKKDSELILKYSVGNIKKFPVQDYTLGDVDGDGNIDSVDALFVLQYESGKRALTDTQKLAADVDGDRYIGKKDSELILKYSGRIIKKFPLQDFIPGDVNGDGRINSFDASLVLQYEAGKFSILDNKQKLAADVDGDGHIGEKDSKLVLQYYAGNIKKFPLQDYILGDVDGDGNIDSSDALWALQYESGKRVLTNKQKLAADVDGDRYIGEKDAKMILSFSVGNIEKFPLQGYIPGDVDGDGRVNSFDASMVLQYEAGNRILTDTQKLAADVDGDKYIGKKDSELILQYTVEKIKKFPVQDYILGDVNGDGHIDSSDALLILQYENGTGNNNNEEDKKLAKVTGLKATVVGNQVKLNWNNVEGAEGYIIAMRASNENNFKSLGARKNNSVTIVNCTPNMKYFVRVAALGIVNNEKIASEFSDTVEFTIENKQNNQKEVPAKIDAKSIKYTQKNNTVSISWAKAERAEGYEVSLYLYGDKTGKPSIVKETNNTNITIDKLTKNTTYMIRLRGYNTVNGKKQYGVYSSTEYFTIGKDKPLLRPADVTGLSLVKADNTSAQIKWNRIEGVESYEVFYYWSKTNINKESKIISSIRSNIYTLTNLTPGTKYYVEVRAINTVNGNKQYSKNYSNTLEFTTARKESVKKEVPAKIDAKSIKYTQKNNTLSISWAKAERAEGYEVSLYLYGNKTGKASFTKEITSNRIQITKLATNATYMIRLRGYNTVNGKKQYGVYSSTEYFTIGRDKPLLRPADVTGLSLIKADNTSAQIKWNKVSEAESYEIFYYWSKTNINKDSKIISSVKQNSYKLTNLKPGTKYYVEIRAINTVNGNKQYSKNYSNTLEFTTARKESAQKEVPAKIDAKSIKYTQKNNRLSISWAKAERAEGYEVSLYLYGNKTGKASIVKETNNTSITIDKLTKNTTYMIRLRGYNTVNGKKQYGVYSSTEYFTIGRDKPLLRPADVTGLSLVKADNTSAQIKWNKVSEAESYEIFYYWSKTNINKDSKIISPVKQNSYKLTNLKPGTKYYVEIRAINTVNGNKQYSKNYSNTLEFTTTNKTINQKPSIVKNVKATPDIDSILLSWTKSNNAEGYEISINEIGGRAQTFKTEKTKVTINHAKSGTTYQLKVRAFNTVDGKKQYSNYSSIVKVTTKKQEFKLLTNKVTGIKVKANATRAQFNWNSIKEADGYEIEIYVPNYGYIKLGSVSQNRVIVSGFNSDTEYGIRIRAYKTVRGDRQHFEYSDTVEFKTQKLALFIE